MAFARVLCVAALVSAASAANYTYTWIATTFDSSATQPPARHSAAMAAFGGSYFVFGGKGNTMNGSSVLGEPCEKRWCIVKNHSPLVYC